ncbi:Conserved exported hypothetical protein [Pseudoalteromonas sp. 3J6]|uniref:hypothetical protein n=1 Tax=Pseudoalteromonas sp. 3J6 TaxID=649161 RepID=UPI001757D50D|nr:hypothetical protein [Pseudoalteromonas sp. 3J6]CAD2223556.1 Conserved exported hypothetical protein [Pseudoalteromonas sp. 3J6]
MKLSGLFKISLVATAITLAGCGGGDINVTPTTVDNSVDNSVTNPGGDNGGDTVSCATYTLDGATFTGEAEGVNCLYSQAFASNAKEITSSFVIPALDDGGAHVFEGALFIGDDVDTSTGAIIDVNGPTLSIEAGATIAFTKPESFIRIARGANIEAIGEVDKPIIFTSIKEVDGDDSTTAQIGDWGGVQVNGRGHSIRCTATAAAQDMCNHSAEGIVSYYGGNDPQDSSGILKHIVIKYAGFGVEGDELNGLTLNAVGSGTTIDYVHVHNGFDDGIELFGGSVNLKHIVVTDTGDDGIDWDEGWKGYGQYILVRSNEYGNHGFETDGAKVDPLSADAQDLVTTVSNPTIANATVVTTGDQGAEGRRTGAGMEMKEWGKAQLANMLFVNSSSVDGAGCFDLYNEKDKSGDAGVHANANNGDIAFMSSIFACGKNFEDVNTPLTGALASFDINTWFTGGENNQLIGFADFSNVLGSDGVSTAATITDSQGTAVTTTAKDMSEVDSFFTNAGYIGALKEGESSEWADFVAASLQRASN